MGGRFGELAADAVAPQIGRGDRRHAGRMVDAQIAEAERQWLYGWIIERDPTPPEFETPVMAKVRAFMRAHVAAEVGKGIG